MDHSTLVKNMMATDDDYEDESAKLLKKYRVKVKLKKIHKIIEEEDYDDWRRYIKWIQ